MRPYNKHLEDYYVAQVGGLPYFAGRAQQRGHGLGSIFRGLAKVALPLLKKVGKKAGKELLNTGLALGGDIIAGKNVKRAIKSRGKETAKRLLTGKGIKRRRRVRRVSVVRVKRRKTSRDIF